MYIIIKQLARTTNVNKNENIIEEKGQEKLHIFAPKTHIFDTTLRTTSKTGDEGNKNTEKLLYYRSSSIHYIICTHYPIEYYRI